MKVSVRRLVGSLVFFAVAAPMARDGGWPYGAAALLVGSIGGVALFGLALHRGEIEPRSETPWRAAWTSPAARAGAAFGAAITPIAIGVTVAIAPNGGAVVGAALAAALGAVALLSAVAYSRFANRA